MKRRLIAHGNTYCGKTGAARTVTKVRTDRFGSPYVDYVRADGSSGTCRLPAFQSWAIGFHNAGSGDIDGN